MAAILAFDHRRRTAADLTEAALLIRVRIAARLAGCNEVERSAVASEAAAKRASGESPHQVIEQCASLARALVRQRIARTPA